MTKLETVDGGINWTGGKRLKDLDYAEDIRMFAKVIEYMKSMTEVVRAEVDKAGLKVNTKKTEIMKIHSTQNQSVTIAGTDLREVEKFTYLG